MQHTFKQGIIVGFSPEPNVALKQNATLADWRCATFLFAFLMDGDKDAIGIQIEQFSLSQFSKVGVKCETTNKVCKLLMRDHFITW